MLKCSLAKSSCTSSAGVLIHNEIAYPNLAGRLFVTCETLNASRSKFIAASSPACQEFNVSLQNLFRHARNSIFHCRILSGTPGTQFFIAKFVPARQELNFSLQNPFRHARNSIFHCKIRSSTPGTQFFIATLFLKKQEIQCCVATFFTE